MSLNANNLPHSGGNRKPVPAMEPGTYPARLVQVVLLGIQPQRAFKGEEKPPVLTLRVTYEFLDEFLKDEDGNDLEDKPRWLSEDFPFHSLKADRAKSTKRYTALDPNMEVGGDWSQLLGVPCMVTVTNYVNGKGDTRDQVSGVSSMRPKEAQKAPELKNESVLFDFYEPNVELFKTFPEWLQEVIKGALDFGGSKLEAALEGREVPKKKEAKVPKKSVEEDLDDEIPFGGNENDGEADW